MVQLEISLYLCLNFRERPKYSVSAGKIFLRLSQKQHVCQCNKRKTVYASSYVNFLQVLRFLIINNKSSTCQRPFKHWRTGNLNFFVESSVEPNLFHKFLVTKQFRPISISCVSIERFMTYNQNHKFDDRWAFFSLFYGKTIYIEGGKWARVVGCMRLRRIIQSLAYRRVCK